MIEYRVAAVQGYTEKMGELVFLLEHTRAVTLSEVADLSQTDLDYLEHNGNSIGALLAHIAAIEKVHQLISFEKRDFNANELVKWKAALELNDLARKEIKEEGVAFYIRQLTEVRKQTLDQLSLLDDEWLYEQNIWPNGTPYNNYYLWFHVLEDEINHRGQIKSIKRKLKNIKELENGNG